MARLVKVSREKRVRDVWRLQKERNDYAEEVRAYIWGEMKLDAIICKEFMHPFLKIRILSLLQVQFRRRQPLLMELRNVYRLWPFRRSYGIPSIPVSG